MASQARPSTLKLQSILPLTLVSGEWSLLNRKGKIASPLDWWRCILVYYSLISAESTPAGGLLLNFANEAHNGTLLHALFLPLAAGYHAFFGWNQWQEKQAVYNMYTGTSSATLD